MKKIEKLYKKLIGDMCDVANLYQRNAISKEEWSYRQSKIGDKIILCINSLNKQGEKLK